MRALFRILSALLILSTAGAPTLMAAESSDDVLVIKKTKDFELRGMPIAEEWTRTPSITIPLRKGESQLSTRAKILYSDTGLYFLLECEDAKLTSAFDADFQDLWNGDVVEVFLKPEGDFPVYFEYELSPLGFELPIMVPNNKGKFFGWLPWHYEGERRVRKNVLVIGERKNGAAIEGWVAEFFIPFDLLKPLGNVPPKSGTRWQANIYRIDYDTGKPVRYEWQPVGISFHEYEKYGTFVFE